MSDELFLQKAESMMAELSLEDMIILNRMLVQRINYIQKTRSLNAMVKFKLGEEVSFQARDGRMISGKIIKFNTKTVTLVTEDNGQWTVSPQFLMRKI